MTLREIERRQAALDHVLTTWLRKARSIVDAKMDDARGHALHAITPTMKTRPAGRTTLGALRRHPSYLAAQARIQELKGLLADLIKSAREDFCLASVMEWDRVLPDRFTEVEPKDPPQSLINECRSIVLYGHTIEYALSQPIYLASRRLLPAAETAARSIASAADSRASLDVWRVREGNSVQSTAALLLRTSLTRIDVICGRWFFPDALLHPDEAPYGGA